MADRYPRGWTERPCRKCGEVKQREEFAKANARDGRRRPYCKPCWAELGKLYRKQCPGCRRRAERTAWKGLFCPKCRQIHGKDMPGAQHGMGDDLLVLAEITLFHGRDYHELTPPERNVCIAWAKQEAAARGVWPTDETGRNKRKAVDNAKRREERAA